MVARVIKYFKNPIPYSDNEIFSFSCKIANEIILDRNLKYFYLKTYFCCHKKSSNADTVETSLPFLFDYYFNIDFCVITYNVILSNLF